MANFITFLRIPLAVAILFVTPFSPLFWTLYLCGGFTDIIDGIVARALKQESALGAKADSIADFVFATAIAAFVVINIDIPLLLWACIMFIALLRLVSYGIGFYKHRTLVSLHTYANKITGFLLFAAPVIYSVCGVPVTGVILCVTAFASALEEMAIIIKSKELNRDCKSIFVR